MGSPLVKFGVLESYSRSAICISRSAILAQFRIEGTRHLNRDPQPCLEWCTRAWSQGQVPLPSASGSQRFRPSAARRSAESLERAESGLPLIWRTCHVPTFRWISGHKRYVSFGCKVWLTQTHSVIIWCLCLLRRLSTTTGVVSILSLPDSA